MIKSLKTLLFLCLIAVSVTLLAQSKGGKATVQKQGKPVLTTKYYYHWSHTEGKPHPEDLILALDYEQNGSLYKVRFYCTTDEYDLTRKGYLPGFWLRDDWILPDDKVADRVYNLCFSGQGVMIYDRPVDVRFKENDDAWKSGKYNIWRHMSIPRPKLMNYTMVIDQNGSLTLKGNGRPARKFAGMDETKVCSLNRNTYTEQQLASNRRLNPVDDPHQARKPEKKTINYPDSSFYLGEVNTDSKGKDHPHGQGRREWKSGLSYDGQWVNGTPEGKGTMTWPSGDRYEGDWVSGVRTGKGRSTFANGDRYEGDWVENKWSGHGIGYWSNTDGSYEGDFANGKRNGYGVMRWGEKSKWSGDRYEGQWEDGWRTGQGTYYYADGRVEKGRWYRNELVEPEESKDSVTSTAPALKNANQVAVPAHFPGGDEALANWLNKHIRYPQDKDGNSPSGRVIVAFDVDTLGCLVNIHVVRGVCEELDQEVLRLVRKMPRWSPALDANNRPVKMLYNMPVFFGTPGKEVSDLALAKSSVVFDVLANSTKVQVDYKKQKEWVKKHSTEYAALLKQFREEPHKLTQEEVFSLYYGFPFTKGYDRRHVDLLEEPRKLIAEGKFQEAYDLCLQEQEKVPVSISVIGMTFEAAQKLGKKDECSRYLLQASRIQAAIISSGTGFSHKSPLQVIFVSDENAFCKNLVGLDVARCDLRDGCDVLSLDRGNKGESVQLYFRVPKMK